MMSEDIRFPNPDLESCRFWPGHPPELYKVSISKYWERIKKSNGQDKLKNVLGKLKERLPSHLYRRICASLVFQYRYSYRLFPYFRLLVGEFLNEEWLALMDFRRAFHRDHIYHQPQVAIISDTLMETLIFPNAEENKTLLELAAYQLALPRPKNAYLHAFCRRIGIPERLYKIQASLTGISSVGSPEARASQSGRPPGANSASPNPADQSQDMNTDHRASHRPLNIARIPVSFWSEVIRDATLTASLFHDIGYPFQFHSHISKDLNALTRTDLRSHLDCDRVFSEMRGHLLTSALAGYRDLNDYPLPCGYMDSQSRLFREAIFETHGMPGALSFLYLKDIISDFEQRSEDPIGLLKTEMAAMAIMMHDMQKIYADTCLYKSNRNIDYYLRVKNPELRLSFAKDPVSFILTLSDLIQDYRRTNVIPNPLNNMKGSKQEESEKDFIKHKTEQRILESRIAFDMKDRILSITIVFDKSFPLPMYRQKEDFNKKIYAQFFEKQFGYLDYDGLFTAIKMDVLTDDKSNQESSVSQ